MKNYIGFVNDHSGSMSALRQAAISDYNANITATKDAASREMLDTVVSVVGIGIGDKGYGVKRQVVISNPHVLRPVASWSTDGGTPLYDGVGSMIELFESLPDAQDENVSFLVQTTTDGQEMHSKRYSRTSLRTKIEALQRTGRWTFVFRVPVGNRRTVEDLGVPVDNIQEWETTAAGMAKSAAETKVAVDNFYTARSAGAKSSSVFYAKAQVDTKALKELDPKEVSLYVVPQQDEGVWIRDFILTKRMQYLKGAAFYQLTKTEARVSHTKLVVVRDRTTGKLYSGAEARQMIGLPTNQNARLHPGDHGNFDIFIQSESINRKLVGGTGVLYWEALGKPFTDADLAFLQPKPAAPAVVQLPAVPVSTKPTPSPIAPTPKTVVAMVDGMLVKFFDKRDDARDYARSNPGTMQRDAKNYSNVQGANGKRWFVFL